MSPMIRSTDQRGQSGPSLSGNTAKQAACVTRSQTTGRRRFGLDLRPIWGRCRVETRVDLCREGLISGRICVDLVLIQGRFWVILGRIRVDVERSRASRLSRAPPPPGHRETRSPPAPATSAGSTTTARSASRRTGAERRPSLFARARASGPCSVRVRARRGLRRVCSQVVYPSVTGLGRLS